MNENTSVNDLSSSQRGISNTTIAVLVILALVITIIGTLAVLDSTASSRTVSHRVVTNVGRVSLSILPPETPSTEPVTENIGN